MERRHRDHDGAPGGRLPWGLRPGRALAVVAAGYALGALPVAAVAGRRAGIDVHAVGDRNPGYWNLRTSAGPRAALPVLLLDMGKGAAAGGLGRLAGGGAHVHVGVIAAMAGHAWPPPHPRHGGRSLLAFVGGLAAISPATFAASWGVCLATAVGTGSFAVGARLGVASVPLVQAVVERDLRRVAGTGVLMSFVGMRFLTASSGSGGPATRGPGAPSRR